MGARISVCSSWMRSWSRRARATSSAMRTCSYSCVEMTPPARSGSARVASPAALARLASASRSRASISSRRTRASTCPSATRSPRSARIAATCPSTSLPPSACPLAASVPTTDPVVGQHALDGPHDALPALARRARVALLVAHDQRQEVRPAPEEAQDREHDLAQHRLGRRGRLGGALDLARDPLEARLEGHAVEAVFGRKVEVDGPLPHPGARRHLAHQHPVKVALREHRSGRRPDAPPFVVVTQEESPELTGQF